MSKLKNLRKWRRELPGTGFEARPADYIVVAITIILAFTGAYLCTP